VKGDIRVTVPGLEAEARFERTNDALTVYLPEGMKEEPVYALRVTEL
jgi:hypothetical protein